MAAQPATANGEDVFLTVRVPRDLRDQLNALAEKNDRTQAAEIRIAIRKHVADSLTR